MLDLGQFAHDLSDGYRRHIIDLDKQPQFFLLLSFLVTFATVRTITHAIRAGRWKKIFRNISTSGGTHLHHLVPGILLILTFGYLGIAEPGAIPRELIAVFFGIGAALTLDEFALWLHLEDVYWAKQGRQSIDAVVVAATFVSLGVLGRQFWADVGHACANLFS